VGHARAKLTPLGRLLLVQRVVIEGWPVVRAAEAMGVSRATAHKWVGRFREEGPAGLEDRSSRPRSCPGALPPGQVRRILRARHRLKAGPHRLGPSLGIPRSTVYAVLRRHGLSRLRDADRPTGIPVRYARERPGELLHLDVKKLGRVPAGGGKRMLGKRTGPAASRGVGNDFLHVAVDDASRVAYVEVHPNERGPTAARFLLAAAAHFAEQGVRVERVMTDRAFAYTHAVVFQEALEVIGARHKLTRPYRPQTNGKAERFIQTLQREWAYARLYRSNEQRLGALRRWVEFYNRRRPHTALGGRPPMAVLVDNVNGNDS
jgi:transposase InsO family protein